MKIISVIGASVMSILVYIFMNTTDTSIVDLDESSKFNLDIVGAVETPKIIEVNNSHTLLDIINNKQYDIRLTIYANKSKIENLYELISKDTVVHIPYIEGYEPKDIIPCVDNLTVDLLTKNNITSNNIAISIINTIKKYGHINSYDILDAIPGIGKVTLGKIIEFSELC